MATNVHTDKEWDGNWDGTGGRDSPKRRRETEGSLTRRTRPKPSKTAKRSSHMRGGVAKQLEFAAQEHTSSEDIGVWDEWDRTLTLILYII